MLIPSGFIVISLVIIDDLNVVRISVTPDKTDTPLVVDAYTVRPGAIALEQFQLIARRYAKILQLPCLTHAVLKRRLCD
jgi:hypothetical protein